MVKDVIVFINLCLTDDGPPHLVISPIDPRCCPTGVNPGQWRPICDELVTRLDEYSNALLRNIWRFVSIGDIHGAEIMQSGYVGCLARLAVLCVLIGRLGPNSRIGHSLSSYTERGIAASFSWSVAEEMELSR